MYFRSKISLFCTYPKIVNLILLYHEFQNILLENEGQISTITINRPHSLNALNGATISELSEALSQLEQ